MAYKSSNFQKKQTKLNAELTFIAQKYYSDYLHGLGIYVQKQNILKILELKKLYKEEIRTFIVLLLAFCFRSNV